MSRRPGGKPAGTQDGRGGRFGGAGVFVGITRLARFDARGMACFAASTDAFLASLAPLLAFGLVGSGLLLSQSDGYEAGEELAVTVCALLAPAVLSHLFARLWRREERWLRYAAAFNWCQWAIPAVASLLLLVLGVLMAAGLPNSLAGALAAGGLVGYALALHWFLARHGLGLSPLRASLLVVGTNAGTGLLVLIPRLVVVMAGLDT